MLLVASGDGLMNAADGAEPGSLVEIVGGIALFALVLPGLGESCRFGSPPAGP